MYKRFRKPLAVFGMLGFMASVLYFVGSRVGISGEPIWAQSVSNRISLPQMGVEINSPAGSEEVIFEVEEIKNVGRVVWARAVTEEMLSPCYLGAYYLLDKKVFSKLSMEDIGERMIKALTAENYMSVRAKEFDNSFFIFEPNKKACPGSLFEVKREVELRRALWQGVSSAVLI